MRHARTTALLAALTAGASGAAGAAQGIDPTGLWLTENERAAIRITRCDQGLCGRVAWIVDDGMRRDRKHPDAAKRDRPMCGLKILWGVEQQADDPNSWEDGTVYKADEGQTYGVELTLEDRDTLTVRGYVGISLLGKSQTWTRVSPEQYPPCDPPEQG